MGGTNREVAEREVEPVKPKGCAVSVENADDPRSLSDGVSQVSGVAEDIYSGCQMGWDQERSSRKIGRSRRDQKGCREC